MQRLQNSIDQPQKAKNHPTGKAKILKILDCFSCGFCTKKWTREKGDIFKCTHPINMDENGYMKEILDPNEIADFCNLENLKE